MAVFGKRSLDNLKGVHPDLVKVLTEAVKNSPVDFTITEGVRSTKRQLELYAQGRTKSGMIVTQKDGIKRKSNHQTKADGYGHAVDLYPFLDGSVRVRESYVVYNLKLITDHIKETASKLGIGISCGIDWKNPFDPPHIELK